MKTNEEIRKEFYSQGEDYYTEGMYSDGEVGKIQDATLLNQLTTMENLDLWESGNTAEEKITRFFAVLRMAKDELTQKINDP